MVEPKIESQEGNRIRVLVVDDVDIARDALQVFLFAYEDLLPVGAAGDGAEAVELCARVQPDVVLMDIKMPVMDGIVATRLMKQKYPGIPVILISNSVDLRQGDRAAAAGAFAYLTKTAAADEIADCIRAAMNQTLCEASAV